MPLHLNLYHEIESQRAASRRDPLKIAAYILAAVVVVFAGLYVWELASAASVNANFARLKAEFDKLDPRAREAEKREQELKQTFETSEKFVKGIESRFYWAPILADLAKIVPREVQIAKMGASVQGDSLKKAQINFEGVAAGADPRRVAEDLRQALVETFGKKYKNVTASFRQLEDSPDTVSLDGNRLPTAVFGIALSMQIGEEAPATPAPVVGRRKRG